MTKTERTIAQPIYAALGAGDLALTQVADIVAALRERTESATDAAYSKIDDTRSRLESLQDAVPSGIDELRARFSSDELRKVAEAYIDAAAQIYNSLAERGEEAIERLRSQPLVREQFERAEKAYSDAIELTEDALETVSAQTRAVGERAARLAGVAASRAEEGIGKDVADPDPVVTDGQPVVEPDPAGEAGAAASKSDGDEPEPAADNTESV